MGIREVRDRVRRVVVIAAGTGDGRPWTPGDGDGFGRRIVIFVWFALMVMCKSLSAGYRFLQFSSNMCAVAVAVCVAVAVPNVGFTLSLCRFPLRLLLWVPLL